MGKKSKSHMNVLWRKFARIVCEEEVNVRNHVNEIVVMANELIVHGRNLDEKTIVSTIIDSLPESQKYIGDFDEH